MKKMFLATAASILILDVLNRHYSSKPAAVTPKPITHHFLRFWNWAERKLSMQPKILAAQKMLLKQKPSKHS